MKKGVTEEGSAPWKSQQRLPLTPCVQTRAHVPSEVADVEGIPDFALQGGIDVLLIRKKQRK